MSDLLLYQQDGAVVTLTMNQDETRNAISSDEMIDAFEQAARKINRDDSVSVVILTGAGKAFSSGGNVKDMHEKGGMFGGSPVELREGYRRGIQRIPLAMHNLEVPLIAAVNGAAIGAGCDLAMMCDIRIASTKARFAESFAKIGIIPGDGGAWFLPRAIGMSRACEMAFTGEAVDAETALNWGMVSQVTEPEELMTAARRMTDRIDVTSPRYLPITKKLLQEVKNVSL